MQSQLMRGRAGIVPRLCLFIRGFACSRRWGLLFVCLVFFLLHLPGGKKRSVLGDEVLATIYIGRFEGMGLV